jgi:hypothetical protein
MFYSKIEDASSLFFGDGSTRVECPTDYMAWQASHITSRRIARVVGVPVTVHARVNHGRWIVDCRCSLGVLTHREWKIACCAECGAVFRDVQFPEQADEIERLLLARPDRTKQNWEGESVRRLRLENSLHRIAGS